MLVQCKRFIALFFRFILVAITLLYSNINYGQLIQTSPVVYQDWIVRLHPKIDGVNFFKKGSAARGINEEVIVVKRKISNLLNLYAIRINSANLQTIDFIKQQPEVLKIIRDTKVNYRNLEPNDERYEEQWNMKKIRADLVWHQNTGGQTSDGKDIVIAILEEGIDPHHKDLIDNIWVNNSEIPENGLDEDNNGYVDDYYGLNLADLTDNHDAITSTDELTNHGVSVSGVIGAKGDNQIGITGVNWDSKLLLLSKVVSMSNVIEGYEYIYNLRKKFNDSKGEKGAFIVAVNNSFGFVGEVENFIYYSNPEEAIAYGAELCEMFEKLGDVGVLSIGAVPNRGTDIDITGDIPTSCLSNFFISVTSSNQSNRRSQSAAFGKVSVDLAAPGERILSLALNDKYQLSSGTSLACPIVAGTIGLLYSLPCKGLEESAISAPSETAKVIKSLMLNSVAPISDFDTISVSGGQLDAFETMRELYLFCARELPKNTPTIKYFPNPVKNQLIVDFPEPNTEIQSIRIFDFQGRLVLELKSILSGEDIKLNVQKLPYGMYFLEIITPEAYFSGKVIKQ